MESYLQGGGGLVFFLGDQVLADRYNQELAATAKGAAAGVGILPAGIGPRIDRSAGSRRTGPGWASCARR